MASKLKICKVCYYYNQRDQFRLGQLYASPSGCFDPNNHSGLSPRPELVVMINSLGFIEPMKCSGGSSCVSPEWCPFAHDKDQYLYAAPLHVPGRMFLPTMPAVFANPHSRFHPPDPGGGLTVPQRISTHPPLQVPAAVVHVPNPHPSVVMSVAAGPSSNVTASSRQRPASSSASCEEFSERIETELNIAVIQQELTRNNYKVKMNNLICWEEMNHVLTLGSKCNGYYKLVVYQQGRQPPWIRQERYYQSHCGYLEGITPDQVAYATQASEAVYIVGVRADILRANFNHADNRMYIAFQMEGFQTLCRMFPELKHVQCVDGVNVEFEVNHRYFNNLIKAVNGVSQEVINRVMSQREDFVQPARPEEFPWTDHIRYHLQNLDNEGQLAAMSSIFVCRNDSPVILLRGSFGTGKTRVLALAAYLFTEFGKKKRQPARVLICAHHQHSADHLVKSYFGPMISDKKHPWENVTLVRLNNRDYVESEYCMSFKRLCVLATSHDLQNSSLVVVTTFLTSLCFHDSQCFPRGFFSHVLIDEGGQAREPETLAPLCLATKNTKIVIAGDPCQVGPAVLVLGDEARENGLKLSLMDRLRMIYHKYGAVAQPYVITLLKNYRCHKSILAVPNQLFYRSQLIPNADLQDEGSPYPLFFVCSSLDTTQPRPEFEAQVLLNQVSDWVRRTQSLNIGDVSIVTTTRTQLVVTRNLANKRGHRLQMLTTYTIQGKEFQAVFWSTTERVTPDGNSWNPTISPCDRYVFNTVLTRAKSLVVVVGSPLVLLEVEKHMVKLYGEQGKCWSLYILNCLQNNTLIIPGLVETSMEAQNIFKRHLKKIVDSQQSNPQSSATNPCPPLAQPQSNPETVKPKSNPELPVPTNTVLPRTKSQHTVTVNANSPKKSTQSDKHSPISSSAKQAAGPKVEKKTRSGLKSRGPVASKTVLTAQVRKSPSTTRKSVLSSDVPPKNYTSTRTARATPHATPAHHTPPGQPSTRKQKRKANKGRTETSSNNHLQGASFTEDDFPTLADVAAVKDKVPKYTPILNLPVIHSDYYLEHKGKLSESLLEEELTRDNYKERFHQLLCWEEMEHEQLLEEKCNGEYTVTFYQTNYTPEVLHHEWDEEYIRYGYILTDDADIFDYAKQASDGLSIVFEDNNTVIRVKHAFAKLPKRVHSHFNAIGFALTRSEVRKLNLISRNGFTETLPVRFDLKHSYFRGLHEALDNLPEAVVARIVPSKHSFARCSADVVNDTSVKYQRPPWPRLLDLDYGQLQTLSAVMQCSPEIPVLLAGPFGTGKTRLLARAAYEILKESRQHRVLICAHHQVSVDTFVEYFGQMKQNEAFPWFVKFVRVTPNEYHDSETKKKYREFYRTKHSVSNSFNYQLVVTTFGTAPSLVRKIKSHSVEGFFTHILIDEGAQSREPETLGPLCFAGENTKIIIAGDHYQVGPQLLVLGEKAQKHGLQISILERLHKLYESLGDVAESYSASLMTNYRCHSGILMLPSSLFYASTLQCRVDGSIPHPLVTFPLQFYCPAASFQNISNHLKSTDKEEARALLDVVVKFCSEWPEHDWGKIKENMNRLCIMSPSASQCSVIRTLIRTERHYQNLDGIKVLLAYKIQGQEFRAIFIGTSEATDVSGESKNPTKSVCDPYVFNTAVTRSQSLVVAVGNPFLLLSIEESMVKKYKAKTGSGDKARCWSQYMKRCLECNTLYILKPPKKENHPNLPALKELLFKKVFSDSFNLEEPTSTTKTDSILKAYRKTFESIPACQKFKLTLSRVENADIAWKFDTPSDNNTSAIDETRDESGNESISSDEQFDERYECVLNFVSLREVDAIPLDASKSVVQIKGRKNRIGTFDGDTVQVGVFKDCPEGKHYGRVLINPNEPIISDRQGNDRNFLCRVFHKNPIVFCPVDRKNPNFVNLPRLSRDMLTKRKKETISEELQSKDVVVFNPKSIEAICNGELPQIQNVIPLSVAKNMLFIVSFIQWNTKYRSPLGMVICAIPKGTTQFRAERLLKLHHNVQYNDDSIEFPATDTERDPTTGPLFDRVFTIDPDGAQNLDDALSLKRLSSGDNGDVFELGVHIANVAKHLSHDSREDKEARQMGTSVYGGSKGKIMHMLSMETRKKLSLTPQCVRDVVSVIACVTINGESIQIEEPRVKMAQIRSTIQLTYSNAQEIMDGKKLTKITKPQDGIDRYNSDKKQPSLSNTMQLLYKLACCMKLERLKTDAAYCYDVNEPEDAHCWQTHMLVEELMIWANSTVAKRLHERFADCALLRRQGPPNEEEMKSFVSENRPLLSHSCSLSHYLALYAMDDNEPLETTDLVIPRRTLANLQTAMSSKELVFLVSLLTSDRYYPQLAAVHSQLKSNFQRAEYCCTDSKPLLDSNETISSENKPSSEYRHFSLCLDEYIHFTSPMRRYCDVMVQRMVQRMVSGGPLNFNKKELRQLCHNLNSKDRNASHFEKSMKNVRLAVKFSSSSEVFDAFISQVKKGSIELFFPDLELNCLPKREKKIRVRHIGPFNKQTGDIEQTSNPAQLYHWKVKMTSMNEKQGTHVLDHMCSRVQLKKMSGGQKEADSNISLEVLCSKDDESQTMSKQLYTAPLNTSMVVVSPEKWNTALEFVKNPTENKMTEFKAVLPDVPPANTPTTVCPFNGSSPFLNYMLKLSLSENSSLKVWMTWALQEAHITPTVQMVELSPAVRICVQHNVHPAECFSDQDLSKASRKHYQNIKEYVKLWERVLLAEAAEKSVKEFQPIIIRDVTLKWPELSVPSNCIDEVYYTIEDRPNDTIEKQSVVMKQPAHFVEQCSEFFRINVGDLMCVRYGTDPHSGTRAVFHLVVHRVDEEEDDNNRDVSTVYMKFIGDSNCRISERLVKEKVLEQSCELQLISLTISYQRVYKGLLKLDKTRPRTKHRFQKKEKPTSKLVSQIALGKEDELKKSKVPGGYREAATTVFDKDSLATTLWGLGGRKQLNKGQREAIELVLNQEFQLIQGPPGTGKSETGAHIAYMFAMANKKVSTQHCVLYCGPSNKSVDVVLSKLHSLCQHHPGFNLKILRIYSRSVERKDHISPQTHQAVSTVSDYSMAKELAEYALHVKLRECKDIKEIKVLKKLEKELIHVEENGEIPNGKLCIAHRKALVKAEEAFLNHNKFDIVLCTCNEAASRRMECVSPRQCIIDESGMATEPESVTPISLCEHVVLIGDHKQLQPVIDYGPAKENGLTTSLFERYAEKLEGFTTTLTIQYRMHEAICEFPSEHFYDGKLKADHSVKVRTCPETKLDKFWPKGADLPILFCDVVGEEGRSETGRQGERKVGIESKSNRKEAEKVVEIVRVLHYAHRVAFKQIAVLTPYSAQREEIKRVMVKHPDLVETTSGSKKPAVKVASITESQGDEYGIVILSTVRSQPLAEIAHPEHIQPDRGWLMEHLGFITDKHQINVGITRSKYGLVIVGNKMLLKYDDTWKELIQHYEERGCVKVGRQFPCSRDHRDLVRRTAQ